MTLLYTNFAQTRLKADCLIGDTTLTVQDATVFPSTGNFYLIIDREILKATARPSSTTLTVVRGQQGTSAVPQVLGSQVIQAITRDDLKGFQTVRDTFANRPAAGVEGRLFWASDGPLECIDDGSNWKSRVFGHNVVEFQDSSLSWVNQGGASLDTTYGYTHLAIPASSGTSIRTRVAAVGGTHDLRAFVNWTQINSNFQIMGLCWRSSGDGKITIFGAAETGKFVLYKYSSATAFAAAYTPTIANATIGFNNSTGIWLRLQDDGATRYGMVSLDGIFWIVIHSFGRTDYHTPDQVGYCGNVEHNLPAHFNVYSWSLTA
jgi:hypothetical protein